VPAALIDHHCHGVVTADLDAAGFAGLLTESPWPAPPGTSALDGQLGFAVRRWCAPLLDLDPFAPADQYVSRRRELGAAEVNRRLLQAAGVEAWLVDTGYQAERLLAPAEFAAVSGSPARPVVRLESVAEQVAGGGVGAAGFAPAFAAALDREVAAGAVAVKTVAAYRYGLRLKPGQPSSRKVAKAAGNWLRSAGKKRKRLEHPVLLRYVIWAGMERGLPVQFHTGFGDPDVRLHRADPSLLHDFLVATAGLGTPVMLLHCYPFHRQAGYLAQVFPHVYLDVGQALNHVGARSAAVLAEAIELAPFHKLLYSSDAFGLAELHYLGAVSFRRDLRRVLDGFVRGGAWSGHDADRVAAMIGSGNARRVYAL
jgi:uncharacterized protein